MASVKVMDYSLLIGIHYQTEENERETKRNKKRYKNSVWQRIKRNSFMQDFGGMKGENEDEKRDEIYFMGIIDILIKFEARKKMEHLFKKIPYGDEVSVVPPLQYSERFYNFIKNLLPQTETEEMLIEKEVPSPSTSVITSKKKEE